MRTPVTKVDFWNRESGRTVRLTLNNESMGSKRD